MKRLLPEQDVDQILTWCPFGHHTHPRKYSRRLKPYLPVLYMEGESYGDGHPQRRWDEGETEAHAPTSVPDRKEAFLTCSGLSCRALGVLAASQNQGGGRMLDVYLAASEDVGDN